MQTLSCTLQGESIFVQPNMYSFWPKVVRPVTDGDDVIFWCCIKPHSLKENWSRYVQTFYIHTHTLVWQASPFTCEGRFQWLCNTNRARRVYRPWLLVYKPAILLVSTLAWDSPVKLMTCSNLIGAALLAAAEQVAYTHDTRPFLAHVWRGWPARLTHSQPNPPYPYHILRTRNDLCT